MRELKRIKSVIKIDNSGKRSQIVRKDSEEESEDHI